MGIDFTTARRPGWASIRHKQLKTPPTFSGGGVAAEDVDGDSDVDLLFVGGAGIALLLNDGRGTFVDASREAGIEWLRADGTHGEARNPIIADFDNDGRQDILITYVNDDHRLYRNVGGARFEDVTQDSGLGGEGLVAGPAAVFDFDSDGLLDVYITYFGDYLHGKVPTIDRNNQNALPNQLFPQSRRSALRERDRGQRDGGLGLEPRRYRMSTSIGMGARTSSWPMTTAETRSCGTWAPESSKMRLRPSVSSRHTTR